MKMRRSILVSALMVLFIVSIIPVLAQEDVDLTVNVVFTYSEEVPADTPTTIDASDEADVVLEDFTTDEPATVTIIVSEENPHPEAEVPPDSPMVLGIYLDMDATVTEFTTTIKVYYTDDEVEAAGIDEDTLRLYYFDDPDWVKCEDTGVETEENYIWAQVTHFTVFSPFGAPLKQPPVADADGPYYCDRHETILLDGSGSYDSDGIIISYDWTFGDGTTGTGVNPSHTYSSTGVYTVTLTVTDDDDLTGSDSTTVTVTKPYVPGPSPGPSNKKPKADAGPNMKISVGSTLYFSGAGSEDPDGTILSYRWDFGDGTTATGVETDHTYTEPGHYTVTLVVKDNRGAEDSDKCEVMVWEWPAPVADKFGELVPGEQKGFKVDATEAAKTTVTLNTTKPVTVTVLKYEDNPHPDDPMPAESLSIYVDVEASDPDAVDWPIYVEVFYTDEEVEALDEASLGIYYWMDGEWHRCSNTGVDTERKVVWAYMTMEEASGSPILIGGTSTIVPSLPPILSDLTIIPEEVELGEDVTISLDIRNPNNHSITYIVTIRIGELPMLFDVELDSYESVTLSRTITQLTEGTYNVTVDGMTGSFVVRAPLKPAEFVLSNFSYTSELQVEEPLRIYVDIANVGELPGEATIIIEIDGIIQTDLQSLFQLGPGDVSSQVWTTYEYYGTGTHTIQLDGFEGRFSVTAPKEPPYMIYIGILILIIAAVIYVLYRSGYIPLPKSTSKHNITYSLMRRLRF